MNRARLYSRGIVRWLLKLPCEVCGEGRRCWLWHIEIMRCPTCGDDVAETDPRFGRVLEALIVPPVQAWTWVDGTLVPMTTNGTTTVVGEQTVTSTRDAEASERGE